MIIFNKTEKSLDLSDYTSHKFYIEGPRDGSYVEKRMTYVWRLQNQSGVVERQGYVTFSGDDFVEMYNNHYGTHQQRTAYIAGLMGYQGELLDQGLL